MAPIPTERSLALGHQASKKDGDFEAQLVGTDGEDNPVQLLVNDPPKYSVSLPVNRLKGVSGRLLYG